MGRLKLQLPDHFIFTCPVQVRITDLNYGGHVGNDTILSLIHEGRIQYLRHLGYSEMEFCGSGMIMADAAIEFKNELFYGDELTISVTPGELSRVGFELFYKLEKKVNDNMIVVALSRTNMICYDYARKKIVALPEEAVNKLGIKN